MLDAEVVFKYRVEDDLIVFPSSVFDAPPPIVNAPVVNPPGPTLTVEP